MNSEIIVEPTDFFASPDLDQDPWSVCVAILLSLSNLFYDHYFFFADNGSSKSIMKCVGIGMLERLIFINRVRHHNTLS